MYNLQPNEVVLLKDTEVKQEAVRGGTFSNHTDELMLTNLNLVLLKKGAFGRSKGVLTFPVNQIKVHNQQAQASLGKSRNTTDVLEVYFLNGQEQFSFRSGGKRKIKEWITKINEAATGVETPVQQVAGMGIPGAEMVAGALKDTVNVFKSKFGAKPEAPVAVAGKCGGCGAPFTGTQGQALTCGYCGSAQQL